MKQTKIVASISDLHCDQEFIRSLYDAGMNVVRMNTAHANREGLEKLISNVRAVSSQIAIMMDTKGPEIRTTGCQGAIEYHTGDKMKIIGNPLQETVKECIAVSYPYFVQDLEIGNEILIDDGDLSLKVMDKENEYIYC